QADEVHALLVEAVPTGSPGTFAVALEILFAVVVEHVVFARNEEDVPAAGTLENLIDRVELLRLRQVADVARMQDEFWVDRERVDPVDRRFQRADHVGIRRLVESHVAVADLHETQLARGDDACRAAQRVRLENAALHEKQRARARPGHAAEKPAPVNAVLAVIARNRVLALIFPAVVGHVVLLVRAHYERRGAARKWTANPWFVECRSPCKHQQTLALAAVLLPPRPPRGAGPAVLPLGPLPLP